MILMILYSQQIHIWVFTISGMGHRLFFFMPCLTVFNKTTKQEASVEVFTSIRKPKFYSRLVLQSFYIVCVHNYTGFTYIVKVLCRAKHKQQARFKKNRYNYFQMKLLIYYFSCVKFLSFSSPFHYRISICCNWYNIYIQNLALFYVDGLM